MEGRRGERRRKEEERGGEVRRRGGGEARRGGEERKRGEECRSEVNSAVKQRSVVERITFNCRFFVSSNE